MGGIEVFPWTKEREMSLHPVVVGIPRTQGGPNEGQIIQWVITTLNRGQGLACLNQRKLGSWYQGFPRGKTVRKKKKNQSSRRRVLSTGKSWGMGSPKL